MLDTHENLDNYNKMLGSPEMLGLPSRRFDGDDVTRSERRCVVVWPAVSLAVMNGAHAPKAQNVAQTPKAV